MNLTSMVDRKMVDVLREKLKDEKDPLTKKLIESKIARKERDREAAIRAAKLSHRLPM